MISNGAISNGMKAVIPAAGGGIKMRPLTLEIPKPLLKIQGKAVIDYVFDALPDEIDEAIVVVKYLAEKLKVYLGNSYKGRRIRYVEGSEKGNALGLLACREFFKDGERFFILHGDEPQRKIEIESCLRHQYAWVCSEVSDPRMSGVATIGPDSRILEVIEKPENPKSNWSAMGTILADADIFNYAPELNPNGEYHISSMLNQFVKDHPVYMVRGINRPPLRSLADLEWDMKDFLGKA
ncbi:MAG: nucleotidyltransferase family protein [Candidatus Sungbacteria bacterium]|nr:nucleotidyltransferase family protein [Candidatus Sungbacteria bacterium]